MKEEERCSGSSPKSSSSSSSSSLPVSYGVDHEQYNFSSSVSSLSQPFSSPEGSSNKSLLLASGFSLDHNSSLHMLSRDRPCSCLHHMFEWILQRCCGCLC